MTRLNRVIKAFNDYDNLVDELKIRNDDSSLNSVLKELRKEVRLLVDQLKRYGCRRDEKYLKDGICFCRPPKEEEEIKLNF